MAGKSNNPALQVWNDGNGPSKVWTENDAAMPAAPQGASQYGAAGAGYASGDPAYQNSMMGKWFNQSDNPYTDNSRVWMTGANQYGTNNGWDTTFYKSFMDQQQKLAKSGELGQQFTRAQDLKSTGVVTWDHNSDGREAKGDGSDDFVFGDVYRDGVKVGNIYDSRKKGGQYDKRTADLMMSQLLFDGDTNARMYGSTERDAKISTAVDEKRIENNIEVPKSISAMEQQVEINQTREEMGWKGDVAAVLSGATGGAITFGGAGAAASSWTGLGSLPTALVAGTVGAVSGGFGAWMNRDELTEMAARAMVITGDANEQFGFPTAIATGAAEWSGFAGKALMPTTNLLHGGYDAATGGMGDGKSAWYATDDQGDRKVGKWLRAAEFGTGVVDSLAQFASPVGMAAYTAQMTTNISGQVGQLTLSGGYSYDDRRGGFDNIFTDDKGNFDPTAAAAGIGAIGIDAVQLGVARGLGRTASSERQLAGLSDDSPKLFQSIRNKLPENPWAMKTPAGGSIVEMGGYKYALDAGGKAVSRRATASIIAPSEMVMAASARVQALRNGARSGGALSADDLYAAARQLSAGSKPITAAVLNGWGEGTEEAIHAVLEPLSHNGKVSLQEMGDAFFQGMSMGAGMTLGQKFRGSSQDAKLFSMAKVGYSNLTEGGELTNEMWKSFSDSDKQRYAAMERWDEAVAQSAAEKLVNEMHAGQVATVPGIMKQRDAAFAGLMAGMDKSSVRTDQGMVVTTFEDAPRPDASGRVSIDSMPNNAVGSSARQTLMNFSNHIDGLEIQVEHLSREIEKATDPDEIARLEKDRWNLQVTERMGREIGTNLNLMIREIYDAIAAGRYDVAQASVREINQILRNSFDGKLDKIPDAATGKLRRMTEAEKKALSRAVTHITSRYPQDNSGSYQAMLPQISWELTRANQGGDNLLQVSRAVLKPLSADHDGDKLFFQNQLFLDETAFTELRAGAGYFGANEGDAREVDPAAAIEGRTYDKHILALIGDASNATNSTALQGLAQRMIDRVTTGVINRYTDANTSPNVITGISRALTRFVEEARAGSGKAREVLIDELSKQAGGAITERARRTWSNEWLWIDELVQIAMQDFQEAYATHPADLTPSNANVKEKVNSKTGRIQVEVNTDAPTVRPSQTQIRERHQQEAASLGATMNLLVAGDSLFRQFQSLHYTSINSPIPAAQFAVEDPQAIDLALLYETISQGITQTELDRVIGTDSIHARAWAFIEAIARDAARTRDIPMGKALALVANLAVRDVELNTAGEVVGSGQIISVAQIALRQAVQWEERRNAKVLSSNPALQSKYTMLKSMTFAGGDGKNAERAFVEVAGSRTFYELLGDNATMLGENLTPEQYIRWYTALDEDAKQSEKHRLMKTAAYLGRKETKNLPYRLDEIGDAGTDLSAYRSVVDALLTTGNARISLGADGLAIGDFANRSRSVSKKFAETHTFIRNAFTEYRKVAERKESEHGQGAEQAMFRRFLEANPQFARTMMDLIPDSSARAVFQTVDLGNGAVQLRVANWVHDMFLAKTSQEAELIYWRNSLLASWNSMTSINEQTGDVEQDTRQYSRLTNRIHQVIYELNRNGDGGLLMAAFQDKLANSTSVDEVLAWLNKTPGIRGNRAPFVAWYNDTSDFEADQARGGWAGAGDGSLIRESVLNLHTSAKSLTEAMLSERKLLEQDALTLSELRKAATKHRPGAADPYVDMNQTEAKMFRRMEGLIERAGKTSVSLGPAAMVNQLFGVINSFYGSAHTKGQNPVHFDPLGQFEMFRDAYGYNINYERAMAALTSVDLSAVATNPGQAIHDALRSMTDDGRQVTWSPPTAAEMIELLSNEETRPFARNLLFPQVMELTEANTLSMQFMFDKSLTELLKGESHARLFDPTVSEKLKYLAAVETETRVNGDEDYAFTVLGAVGDLLIARLSALTKPADGYTQQNMIIEAMMDVADTLQTTGAFVANDTQVTVEGASKNVLDVVGSTLEKTLKRQQAARRLLLDDAAENDVLFDSAVEILIMQHELQMISDRDMLLEAGDDQGAVQVAEDFEVLKKRIEDIARNDDFTRVVNMYSLDGTAQDVYRQMAMAEYVIAHPDMIQKSAASSGVVASFELIQQAVREGIEPSPRIDWEAIGNQIIALELETAAVEAAPRVGVQSVPVGKSDQRYWDSSFTYLADPFLDPNSPMNRAAARVHLAAGRNWDIPTPDDAVKVIGDRIFKEWSLGSWTSEIPMLSIEARERTLAAPAGKVISAAGDLTKRQGIISAATQRSFMNPGDDLLSTVNLLPNQLGGNLYDDIGFNLNIAGQPSRSSMPLTQLNNRFAKSVLMRFTTANGTAVEVDLLNNDGGALGYNWGPAGGEVDNSDYRVISLARLQTVVQDALANTKDIASAPTLEIQFFHPDSQPAAAEWYNNIFFEGTSFEAAAADSHVSLNASLYFAAGGLNQLTQREALDANKLGASAMRVIKTPTAEETALLEVEWNTNLSNVITAKAATMMQVDMGQGRLDPSLFNATHKNMKLRHWVRGEVNGEAVLLSAEEVIAQQEAYRVWNPGHQGPIPLHKDGQEVESAVLWIPTDSVLRSMLGELGTKGVPTPLEALDYDLSRVKAYTGVSDSLLRVVSSGIEYDSIPLTKTRAMPQSSPRVLSVREQMPAKQMQAYDLQIRKWERAAGVAAAARSEMKSFDNSQNFEKMLAVAKHALQAENLSFGGFAAGSPILGVRNPAELQQTNNVLRELTAMLSTDGTQKSGWVLQESGDSNPHGGLLTKADLGGPSKPGERPTYGDVTALDLTSIHDFKTAKSMVDYLVGVGSYVVLVDSSGRGDLRSDVAKYLRQEMNYDKVGGSKHVYGPFAKSHRYQNQQARTSTWTTTKAMSMRNRLMVFVTENTPLDENAAWAVHEDGVLHQVSASSAIIPSAFMAEYNIPVDNGSDSAQASKVQQHLLAVLSNKSTRQIVLDMGGNDPRTADLLEGVVKNDMSLDTALTRLEDRLKASSNPLPRIGDELLVGDIIPLVNAQGQIVLYRHGFMAPKNKNAVRKMQAKGVDNNPLNIAVYNSEREPLASVKSGRVREYRGRSGRGLDVIVDVDLQVYGDKYMLELNGMKYVTTPMPKDNPTYSLPNHGIFRDRGFDLISDEKSALSKQSLADRIDNHSNAFAVFGIDFMQDVTEFFFPGKGADAASQNTTRMILKKIQHSDESLPVQAAVSIIRGTSPAREFSTIVSQVAAAANLDASIVSRLKDQLGSGSVEGKITTAMIAYLLTDGAQLESVIGAAGLHSARGEFHDRQSVVMPQLFTQVFDIAEVGSPLRKEMNRRINQQINNAAGQAPGYIVHEDFRFEVRGPSGASMFGYLQIPQAYSSGDNPVLDGESFNPNEAQGVSAHVAATAYQATGARTMHSKALEPAKAAALGKGVQQFTSTEEGGTGNQLWELLSAIPSDDATFEPWARMTPAEGARRAEARRTLIQYRQTIDRSPTAADGKAGWTPDQATQYDTQAKEILSAYGLDGSLVDMVDFWARQFLGEAKGVSDEGVAYGQTISPDMAKAALDQILWNAKNGLLPVFAGLVPVLHLHDLQLIFFSNRDSANPKFRLRLGVDKNLGFAGSKGDSAWEQWYQVALGSSLVDSDTLFDPTFLLAADGFTHSYQSGAKSLVGLPVSRDMMTNLNLLDPEVSKSLQLLDPENHEMLLSLDPNLSTLLQDPVMMETARTTLQSYINGTTREDGAVVTGKMTSAVVAKRLDRINKLRRENKMPVLVPTSMENFQDAGARHIDNGTKSNAVFRILINLRVATTLLNPALWTSAAIELVVRGSLEKAADLVTGEATHGRLSLRQARKTEERKARAWERFDAKKAQLESKIAEAERAKDKVRLSERLAELEATAAAKGGGFSLSAAFGLQATFTVAQVQSMQALASTLGRRKEFKGMIYDELMFHQQDSGSGRIEKATEKLARLGGVAQDPTKGMTQKTLARRYMDGVVRHIQTAPGAQVVTVDQLVAGMATNPEWIKNNAPMAHEAGLNNVANVRSLKQTVLSEALREVYDTLSNHHNGFANLAGFMLKVPLMFSPYLTNVAVTLTGLQGVNDMAAMLLHGRKKPGLWMSMQKALHGKEAEEIPDNFDMGSVLQGMDLSRSFMRGALTHTGLFAYGLMNGGLGLAGEDEEAKRRRRAAELQGAAFVYDPRAIENDFRNKDAIFLDWLPLGLDNLFKSSEDGDVEGPAMGFMPWTMKQFISPLIGFEKFYQTGDWSHVAHGYAEAVGSMPIANIDTFKEAMQTSNELAKMAEAAGAKSDPNSQMSAFNFLTRAVGVYESMLFESSALNNWYVSRDRYDRDPYVTPLKDSVRVIQRDINDNPRANDVALTSYIDPETKEVRYGYSNENPDLAELKSFTEKRLTLALFTTGISKLMGGVSTMRNDMAIKTREVEKPVLTEDEAKALVLSAFGALGGVENLTQKEAEFGVIAQREAAGLKGIYGKDKEAAGASFREFVMQQAGPTGGTSLAAALDPASIQASRVSDLIKALGSGQVQFGSDAVKNLYLTTAMREEIEKDFTQQLVQEGVDLGLSREGAMYRMKRIWYGAKAVDSATGENVPGLRDMLWSKDISSNQKLIYNQLNSPYVQGPDGLFWATGARKDGLAQMAGLPIPNRAWAQSDIGGTATLDGRLNVADLGTMQNTGLRAVELRDQSWDIPTEKEMNDSLLKALKAIENKDFIAEAGGEGTGNGYKSYGGYRRRGGYSSRRGGYSGGGGGYFSFSPTYYNRLYALPGLGTAYASDVPFLNVSNPIIRRATVRRERFSSERGRLKQWQ